MPVTSAPRVWAKLVRTHIAHGRFDEAREVLDHVATRDVPAAHHWVGLYRTILDRFPPSVSRRDLPSALTDGDDDIVIVPRAGASDVLFVFCPKRWEAIALHATLSDRALHVVYCFDRRRFGCLGGIESMAPTYRATLPALRGLAAGLPATRIYTLGVSRGGSAAIRYGLDLGASGVLAFSPAVSLGGVLTAEDRRLPALIARLRTMDPEAVVDLRPLIDAAAGRVPIHTWYGEDAGKDRRHMRHVDGAPGVTIHAMEGSSEHNSLLTVLADGRITEALDGLLATPGRHEPSSPRLRR